LEKIAIKIIPTPATQDISLNQIQKISRITRLPEERLRDRLSRGKAIVIITAMHPRLEQLVDLIKSMGFSVVTGPVDPKHDSQGDQKAYSQIQESRANLTASIRSGFSEWRVGDVIENLYEVRDIKQGGMGAVYVVRHVRWNSLIAVKSLLQKLRGNEEDRALFLKEAETWIDIGFHPNIAACYYVRSIQDNPRIFIEYVDGGGLNEWLARRKGIGWDLMIDLMVQVSDGLHHAHSKGLVHRDIKPGNCMMTKDGVLKVTDFGLTKRQNLETPTDVSNFSTSDSIALDRESITAAGMGTPGYMAPEMWIPHSTVGPPADMYAFGIMFFELCCGRKPFVIKPGEKKDKLALAHVRKPPPRPTTLRADMPPAIEEVILKCLNKNPDDRYGSFRQIRDELSSIYEKITKRRFSREAPDEVKLLSDALNNRAVSLMDLNHEEEAKQRLQEALDSDPHHPEATYNKGLLEWFRTKNPDPELLVKMEEIVKTPEYVGRGSYLLGRCALAMGDAARAFKACEVSISSEDSHEEWLKAYSVASLGVGQENNAIKYLETYLNEFPNDDDAMGWLIGALVKAGRREDAAAKLRAVPPNAEIGHDLDKIVGAYRFSGLSELMTLAGHAGWITCLSHFPKSNRLITGARDRTIRIWDALSGKEEKSFAVVGEPPAALWVSPDERIAAIASSQPGVPVKLLDLESGKYVGNLLVQSELSALGFSPDGKHVLLLEQKGNARLWDITDFKAVSLKVPPNTAAAVAYNDDARPTVFLSGLDRSVKKINILDNTSENFERAHSEIITMIRVSLDGTVILTCGRDRRAIVWDAGTGKIMGCFEAHQEHVSAADLNLKRGLAATYDPKSGIKIWDIRTGNVFRTFAHGNSDIYCLSFSPDGDRLLAGGRDMVVRVWDVSGRQIIPTFALAKIRPVTKQLRSEKKYRAMLDTAKKAIKRGSYAMAYSLLRDSQTLSGFERSDTTLDMLVRLKEHGTRIGLHGAWKRKTVETHSSVMDVSFSSSAIYFLTAHADHSLRLWSTKTGDCIKVLKGHTNLASSVFLSVNGREAVSGSDDRSVRVWDLKSGRNLLVLKGHLENVSSVAYCRDGNALVSGSWDRTVRLWRLPDGAPLKIFKGHEDKVTSVGCLNEPGYVVSAGFDGLIKMWDIASGRLLRDLKGHKDRIMCLDVSPKEDFLLSGAMDGTVKIWDVKRGSCVKTLDVHKAGVRTAAFSPDQNFLVTGGPDMVLRFWDIEKGQCQREFQGHSKDITSGKFASSGRFIISSSADGIIMIWELDWDLKFDSKK
jgi:WD40 repeat protein/serine/threonine protein kinase